MGIFYFPSSRESSNVFFSVGPPPALTIFTKLGMGGPRRIARIAQAGEALQELRTQLLFSFATRLAEKPETLCTGRAGVRMKSESDPRSSVKLLCNLESWIKSSREDRELPLDIWCLGHAIRLCPYITCGLQRAH